MFASPWKAPMPTPSWIFFFLASSTSSPYNLSQKQNETSLSTNKTCLTSGSKYRKAVSVKVEMFLTFVLCFIQMKVHARYEVIVLYVYIFLQTNRIIHSNRRAKTKCPKIIRLSLIRFIWFICSKLQWCFISFEIQNKKIWINAAWWNKMCLWKAMPSVATKSKKLFLVQRSWGHRSWWHSKGNL